YRRPEFWTMEGWTWLRGRGETAPAYWRKIDGEWRLPRFDVVTRLPADEPGIHVSWHEANAYCRYARRRLPTEVEWEYAALWDAGAGRKRRYPWGDSTWTTQRAELENAA